MNLKNLNDQDLLKHTQVLVQKERELLTSVLHHLREIGRRRLFSTLGYTSLFEYGVKALGYSEDQIHRRISAMKLLKSIPEIEEKINSGDLTLSNLNLAQSLFRQEEKLTQTPVLKEKKIEVLEKLEGRSAREAKKIILSLSSSPKTLMPEKIRLVTEDLSEVRLTVNQELTQKIEKLKGLLAHSNPNLTTAELFDKLCDLGLQKWDPSMQEPKTATSRKVSKTIPAAIKQQVWTKFQGRCQICSSQYALEIDHHKPKAQGGSSEITNLRLLCRNCNQRAAIEQLGLDFMSRHLG